MPADKRFNIRDFLRLFADTDNTGLRDIVDDVARKLLQLLPGGDPGDITPPGPPTDLTAGSGVTSVTLTWNPPGDLDVVRYRVQRSLTAGSGYSTITETPDTSLIDGGLTGGTTYYYQVAAIDDSNNVGSYSNEAFATPSASGGAGTAPTPPGSVTALAGDTVVSLEWAQTDPTAISTRILRSTTAGSGHALIASGLTGTSYVDTGRTNGVEYFYILRAVNANGDVSADSLEVSATPVAVADVTAPAAPLGGGDLSQPLTTVANTSVIVTWFTGPENDIDFYTLKWGSSPGVYTNEVDVQRSGATIEKYQVFNLTPATTYYFAVTATDTSGNESALSPEADATTGVVPITPVAPAAPTGFVLTASSSQSLSFAWNANTEGDLAGYRLSMAPTQSGPWAQVKTFSANSTSGSLSGNLLVNETTYYFRLYAYNTAAQQSNPSGIVSGTPTASTGGVVVPPGGGTGVGGAFNGDTGLGTRHRAPGATFDYVLDASGTFYQSVFVWVRIGSALRDAQNAGYDFNGKRVAVLLPEYHNLMQAQTPVAGGNGNVGVTLFADAESWNTFNTKLPLSVNTQWHFIAPWPTANLADTPATAKAAVKKFKMSVIDEDQFAYGGSGAGNPGYMRIGTGSPANYGNRVGFWWIHFNGAGRETISGDGPDDAASGGHRLTLYGCDFKHDYPFRGRDGTKFNLPNNIVNEGSLTPRWTVSCYRIGIDQVHYCTFDSPWSSEHLVYERNNPIGDSYTTYCTFLRCGGQIWQETRRVIEGVDLTSGNYAGVHYYVNCTGRYWGRNYWSANAFTLYGTHKLIDMDGCTWVNDATGRATAWPPVNPAPTGYNLSGSDIGINVTAGFVTASAGSNPTVWPMTAGDWAGWVNPGLRMRNCRVFLNKATDAAIMNLNSCRTLDIQTCSFLIKNAGVDRGIWIARYGWDGAPGPLAMLTCAISGNNTVALNSAFEAANPEIVAVSGSMVSNADVLYSPPPPNSGWRTTTPVQNFGNLTATISRTNLV